MNNATYPTLPELLPTDEAARVLCRNSNTLRRWACMKKGPLTPVRVHGRLLWRRDDILALLSGER